MATSGWGLRVVHPARGRPGRTSPPIRPGTPADRTVPHFDPCVAVRMGTGPAARRYEATAPVTAGTTSRPYASSTDSSSPFIR